MILKNQKIDLIYERYAFFNFATLRIAKKRGIPFFLEMNYLTNMPLVRQRTKILKPLARCIENYLLKNADGIFVITRYVEEECKKLGIKPDKIYRTPNAINPDKIKITIPEENIKKQYSLDNNLVIGFVGGFYPWHGLDVMVNASGNLVNINPNIRFMLVGDGPLQQEIQEKVHKNGLTEFYIFTGQVDHDNLWSFIGVFDIAVIPRTNDYGSPVKLFEYMACGKAIVAPDVGPVSEIVDHNSNALLFDLNDPKDFTDKLFALIDDQSLREQLGKNAKETALSKHTWQNNVKTILNHYHGLKHV